ncbi:MAG: DUF3035 domain-containing protein [Azospirillaceae bacterium]
MTRQGLILATAALALAPALSGCGEAQRAFGFDRTIPDEFAVVSRAPLAVPPDYDLRPPSPGAPRPQEAAPRDAARSVLFEPGRDVAVATEADGSVTPLTQGQSALLQQAGAQAADPDIRQVLDEETRQMLSADETFVDSLLFWQEQPEPGTVVDAEAEAERLRTNEALGRPLTEGEVPIIERERSAPLEGIF